jgi:hypothetical protein
MDRRSNLNNLHKLEKLKRLIVGRGISTNLLEHLQFGVFNNLEELEACFKDASLESIQEMKRITPNLKKISIYSTPSETINALLGNLEDLEEVHILGLNISWDIPSEKVHPKIKLFDVYGGFKIPAEKLAKMLPNLETLLIGDCLIEVTESFFVALFSGLKQLKTLNMHIFKSATEFTPESALQCFKQHGENLREANVVFESKSEIAPRFAIQKRSESLFCLNKLKRNERIKKTDF